MTIGSQLTLLNQPDILNVSVERAGKLVSFYWMGAMIGRFPRRRAAAQKCRLIAC